MDFSKYKNTVEYKAATKMDWRAEEARLRLQFKIEALTEFGCLHHPKADAIWDFAWREGHSEGYESVYRWLEELTDLVR